MGRELVKKTISGVIELNLMDLIKILAAASELQAKKKCNTNQVLMKQRH